MQSVLQYRRFRRNLEAEIKRHGIEQVTRYATPVDLSLRERTDEWYSHRQPEQQSQQQPPISAVSNTSDHAQEEARLENEKPATPCVPIRGTDIDAPRSNIPSQTEPHQYFHESEKIEDLAGSTDVSDSSSSISEPQHGDLHGYETDTDTEGHATLRQMGTRLGQRLTGVTVRTRDSKKNDGNVTGHVFIVDYQGHDDPLNPHNWSIVRRVLYTVLIAWIGFIVGFASSVDSAIIPQATEEFGVSEVVESLATGLYLIGFAFGAFFAAPISETIGRNPVYLATGTMYMIFVMASGLAPNIGAQLVFRLIAGFFGSTPLTCAGGSISDMWNATERTALFPVFAMFAFIGPITGPIIGGFIGQSDLVSWRWTEWVTLIWSGLIFGAVFLALPETYAPVLLKWKAEHLREMTGDERYKSALEVMDTTFRERMVRALYRPWLLVLFEPIVILFSVYLTVVYIVLFTFLTGFEFIFTDTYGLSQGLTFLIFIALGIGFLISAPLVPWVVKRYSRHLAAAKEQGKNSLPPEQRLIFAMIGAPFMPIGLFWMAWTSYASVSIWSPIISCLPVGFAIMAIFISTYQYLIDSYEKFAASALVGITFIRYCAAGGMIPVSIPFYQNLGVHWTLTILGAISALLTPVPFIFFKLGPRVRAMSKRAVNT